jgi:hypothetical protein
MGDVLRVVIGDDVRSARRVTHFAEIDGGDVMKTGSILAGNEDIVPQVQEQLRLASAFARQAKIT